MNNKLPVKNYCLPHGEKIPAILLRQIILVLYSENFRIILLKNVYKNT